MGDMTEIGHCNAGIHYFGSEFKGGVYFWKISGGCLIFEFYCIFMH